MTDLQTNEALLKALRDPRSKTPTPEEMQKQRVSFIMGSLSNDSSVTRARVGEILAAQEGRKTNK